MRLRRRGCVRTWVSPVRAAVYAFLIVVVLGAIIGSVLATSTPRDYARRGQRFEQGMQVGSAAAAAGLVVAGVTYAVQRRRQQRRG